MNSFAIKVYTESLGRAVTYELELPKDAESDCEYHSPEVSTLAALANEFPGHVDSIIIGETPTIDDAK